MKIGLPLRPDFLVHQSRYEEKDHSFRIFRHFSWNHSVQNILENSLTFLKSNLKYKYANYSHLMTLTPHVCIDFFISYNSINTHRKSFTSLGLWNKIWIFLTLEICFKINSKNVFTKYFSRFPQKNYKTLTELFFRFRMFLVT